MLLQETFTYSGKVISKNIYPRKEDSQDVWTQNTDLKLFYVSENPKQRKSGKLRERERRCVCWKESKQVSRAKDAKENIRDGGGKTRRRNLIFIPKH